MDIITGFTRIALLHEGSLFRVLRAREPGSGEAVILKCPSAKYPQPHVLHALRHEFAMLRSLDSPHVIRPRELLESSGSAALVLEDYEGATLEALLSRERLCLGDCLRLFHKLVAALGDLHDAGIVHGDMAPQNILVPRDLEGAKLIDLGDARFMGAAPVQGRGVRCHLGYLAPEQALRPNKPADPRSDLYALGAALYRATTGKPPFKREGRRGIMHGHVAAQAMPPHEAEPSVPQVVSDLIMRLLAKEPDGRYQSAHALKRDVEKCLDRIDQEGRIEPFALDLGKGGHSLEPLRGLHGRDEQQELLARALDRSLGQGLLLCLVSGPAGIGKTSLVAGLGEAMAARNGCLAMGKFDSQEETVPFSGLRRALRSLLLPKLGLPNEELQVWCRKLRSILHPTTRLVLDLAPEFEGLLGELPELSDVGHAEAQDRMHTFLAKLLQFLAEPGRPLALFLDDLHWVDLSTLRFMEYLVRSAALDNVFLVGAYRSDEVGQEHELAQSLKALRQAAAALVEIALEPLEEQHVAGMVAEALSRAPDQVAPLARAVGAKSGGNPFFVRQILQGLHQDGLLRYDFSREAWAWDQEGVDAMAVPADAAKFLSSRLHKLPDSCLDALGLAACVGPQFDLGLVAYLAGHKEWDLLEHLFPALRDGLLREVADLAPAQGAQSRTGRYAFAHDRIHQAFQALMDEEAFKRTRFRAGRHLLDTLSQGEQNERLFEIVGQLNAGRDHLASDQERLHLADLNLKAGRRANDAAAFDVALNLFRQGMEVFPASAEHEHHDLWFALHRELALAHSRNGLFDQAETLVHKGMESCWDVYEMVQLQDILIQQYAVRTMMPQAMDIGLKAMRLLGLPIDPSRIHEQIQAEQAELDRLLELHKPLEWISIPKASNPLALWPLRIIANLASVCFVADMNVWRLIIRIGLRLSLEHGNIAESSGAYQCYGMQLMALNRDYEQGIAFGKLGNRIMDEFGDPYFKAIERVLYTAEVEPWNSPYQKSIDALRSSYEECMSVGCTMYSGLSAMYFCIASILKGVCIKEIHEELLVLRDRQIAMNQVYGASLLDYFIIYFEKMQSEDTSEEVFIAEYEEGLELMNDLERKKDFFMVFVQSIMLTTYLYYFGDLERAVHVLERSDPLSRDRYSTSVEVEYTFIQSLVYCAVGGSKQLQTVRENQELTRIWMKLCPENFTARYQLVEAELARAEGRDDEAMDLFAKAMGAARKEGYVHLDGLANELAAKLLMAKGWDKAARPYLRDAHDCYQAWGANRKLKHLRETHPGLLGNLAGQDNANATSQGTVLFDPESLDLGAVLLASRVIAAETSREKLPATLVSILVETTGSSRGALFLINEQGLMLEATAHAGKASVMLSQPAEDCHCAPRTMLRYVLRTGQAVLLEDAVHDNRFDSDYLRCNKPRSVLCAPIFHQGRLFGVVYLENALTPCVFSRERVTTVEHLASQAAIAMENARLYESLAETAREIQAAGKRYQDIFDNTLEGIFQTSISGVVLALNPAMARIAGYDSQQEMLDGLRGLSTNLYRDPTVRRELVGLLQAKGEVTDYEVEMLRKDGTCFWALVNARVLVDPVSGERSILGVLKDVTERKKDHERIHSLSHQLIETQECEKMRISRVLHDHLGQELLSLAMGLGELRKEIGQSETSLKDRADGLNTLAHKILECVRDLAYALRPTILERRGLLEAIRELGQSFQEDTGIAVDLRFTGLTRMDFSPELAIHLYRVINEALANVKRHAQASQVVIRLVHSHPHLILRIEDNGVGLETPLRLDQALEERRLGIQGMRERIHVLGGNLDIVTKPGQGVKLLAEIPYKEELWAPNTVS